MALLEGHDDSILELLDAQAYTWNYSLNYINSMSLKCAIQLGIPDAMHKHGKPITLSQLLAILPVNKAKSNALFRLMRFLVRSNIFDSVVIPKGEEAYCLTRTSRDNPFSCVPLVLTLTDQAFVDVFHHMSEWFLNEDSTPFITKHGKNVWEYARSNQHLSQMFNEGMASDAAFLSGATFMKWKHVFEGMKTMVDVAGGTGKLTGAISEEFPNMKCTVLDLPHVVRGLQGSDKLTYISGDMFEFIPHADVVFLKWILHDWDDEQSVKILEKCKEAIMPRKNAGGKVVIVDMVVDDHKEDDKTTETHYIVDMLLMSFNSGKERTEKEWANLFHQAGFATYKINHVLGVRSVIEVYP